MEETGPGLGEFAIENLAGLDSRNLLQGGANLPLETTDESRATLARRPSGTTSSAEKEQLEELEGMSVAPVSRFRAAAWISVRSEMDGAGKPDGRSASRRALWRDAVIGVDEARVRRAYDTV